MDFYLGKSNVQIAYTEKEDYIVNTLLSLGEIETVYEQLEQSPYFLSNFRQTKPLKKKGITRFNHIIYHIESHLFRATGILDRMLIHINIVFKIGLIPEKCKTYYLLIDKKGKEGKYSSSIKNKCPGLFDNLIELMNAVDKYRELRNLISHEKRYQSEYLKHVEMYHILQQGECTSEFNTGYYKYHVKRETDQAVATYKNQMLNFNEEIRNLLDKIYLKLEKNWKIELSKFI
jgi:hypothetical protein